MYLGGRFNHLNLTLAVTKYMHVTGKDSNGADIWTEAGDKFDVYFQQDRKAMFREGIYYASYWQDGVVCLTGDQLGGLITLLDDLAEEQGSQAEQGGTGMGQEVWEPKYTAEQDEAGPSSTPDKQMS